MAGETVEWEGAPIRMMHPDGFGAARPMRVPIILGVGGPKGEDVARELADGVFATQATEGFDRSSVLCFGTVLDDGEDPGSDRAMAAAGHAAALAYHAVYPRGGVTSLPDSASSSRGTRKRERRRSPIRPLVRTSPMNCDDS